MQVFNGLIFWLVASTKANRSRLRLALSQAYRDRPFGVRRGGVLWKEAHAWSADALNATAARVRADAAACDAPLYREAAALARSSEGGCT